MSINPNEKLLDPRLTFKRKMDSSLTKAQVNARKFIFIYTPKILPYV